MNIIKMLGIAYKEDIISNLLIGIINESESFKNEFLKNILKIQDPSESTVKAHARIMTSFGIPDIIVEINSKTTSTLVIIENKLKAEEGQDQTIRYANKECINEIINNKKININHEDFDTKLIYLTLTPEAVVTSEEFINLTYKDLIENINIDIEDSVLNKIYKDLCEVFNNFYKGLDVHEDDKIIKILTEEEDYEKAFIKFKKIMSEVDDLDELKINHIGKVIGKGRFSFIGKIGKDSWVGCDKVTLREDNTYKITENSYDIHIEPSFDILNQSITLPLHYETNSYIPKKELIAKTVYKDYIAYAEKREEFKCLIHKEINELNDNTIKPYNGSNQIASIKLTINEDLTVKDFREMIRTNMKKLETIVDNNL